MCSPLDIKPTNENVGSFPRSILACGYLFYRDIYLQIPFSSWDGEFKITCLFRNITFIPHLLYKANYHESLTLDPKAKSWLERNLDSRNTKPWGGGMLYCHLTHVPNTYLIEAESVRAQSYSSGLQAYSSPLVLFAVRQLRSEGYGHPGLGNNPSTC